MRMMMTLVGEGSAQQIDDFLASRGVRVLSTERFDPEEAAILSVVDKAAPVVARARSGLSATWTIDTPTRADAIELAKSAPGTSGTLEVREAFVPQDFGAPADAVPPPPPPLQSGKQRYIAFVFNDARRDAMEFPPERALVAMDAYCAPMVADGTMMGGEGLKSTSKGSRIRRSAQQRFVLDGPFTESKELVGGYMILQARSLDEAVDFVRPWLRIHLDVLEMDDAAIEVHRLL